MSGGFFRGTTSEQDTRFSDKSKKMKKSLKFPPHFDRKVNMNLVKREVISIWIREQVISVIGFEDEVIVGMVENFLSSADPDPKEMQIQLTGFLNTKTAKFVSELWQLLLSAMDNDGIPKEFIEKKKEELKAKKIEEERIFNEIRKRQEMIQQAQQAQQQLINAQNEMKYESNNNNNGHNNTSQPVGLQVYEPGQAARRTKRARQSKWDTDEPIKIITKIVTEIEMMKKRDLIEKEEKDLLKKRDQDQDQNLLQQVDIVQVVIIQDHVQDHEVLQENITLVLLHLIVVVVMIDHQKITVKVEKIERKVIIIVIIHLNQKE
eukprot:c19718_g1_i3.p1 GENE.c19718_g1_i3~~c19718_g1_i3.p1  ORF type:complete len:320 (+),score=67.16 c19718_g1_i3:65-1024(+)